MQTIQKRISTNTRVIKEHLTKYKNTFSAFCELINNSIQAQAKEIAINIDYASGISQSPIKSIEIIDNGVGVAYNDFEDKILEIGTVAKSGGQGVGRFGALQIGGAMVIDTVAYDKEVKKYTKVVFPLNAKAIQNAKLDRVDFPVNYQLLDGKHSTYYKVTIDNLFHGSTSKVHNRNKLADEFSNGRFRQAVFEKYPLEIFNGGIKFSVNGKLVTKEEFVLGTPTIKNVKYTDTKGGEHDFSFQFYNINSSANKVKVFFYIDNAGLKTVAHEFSFSSDWYTSELGTWFIYVDSSLFSSDLFRNLDIESLGEEEIKGIKEKVRSTINEFFKAKNKRFEEFIASLEKDAAYPYNGYKPASTTHEALFKKVAYIIEDEHHLIKNQDKIRGFVYTLLDRAIGDGHIEEIFKKVLRLSDESLLKFHDLLQQTDLEDVVQFASQVASKISFLDFLHELIYGDISKVLRERSQLHKIIEKELWLFGENYNGLPRLWSDKKIGNTLEELRNNHFTFELSNDGDNVISSNVEGFDNITDLFFLNDKVCDDGKREVMIVELKAPKCAISRKEIQQIDDYAYTLETYPSLPKEDVRYKLILISSRLTDYAKSKMESAREKFPKPFMYDKKTKKDIEIYVMEWSELIELNKRRLGYLSSTLQVKDKSVKEKFETEYQELIDEKISSRLTKVR